MITLFVLALLILAYGLFFLVYVLYLHGIRLCPFLFIGCIYVVQGLLSLHMAGGRQRVIALRESACAYVFYMFLNVSNSVIGVYGLYWLLPWTASDPWQLPLFYINISAYFVSIFVHFTFVKLYFKHKKNPSQANYILLRVN